VEHAGADTFWTSKFTYGSGVQVDDDRCREAPTVRDLADEWMDRLLVELLHQVQVEFYVVGPEGTGTVPALHGGSVIPCGADCTAVSGACQPAVRITTVGRVSRSRWFDQSAGLFAFIPERTVESDLAHICPQTEWIVPPRPF
jgi:hypothetical protein